MSQRKSETTGAEGTEENMWVQKGGIRETFTVGNFCVLYYIVGIVSPSASGSHWGVVENRNAQWVWLGET